MNIRIVNNLDIPKWWALSHEYDCYVQELVPDLTEWYDGNDTAPAFDEYMERRINRQEAFIVVDAHDNCLGIAAISRVNNNITFFGVTHKADFQTVGKTLLSYTLENLNNSKAVSVNEINNTSSHIKNHIELFESNGFNYSHDSLEHGVPVNTFVRPPLGEKL